VCLFVNDTASAEVIQILSMGGVGLIAMRCAGFGEIILCLHKHGVFPCHLNLLSVKFCFLQIVWI
jgi:lactate dehydrogenase-like 2-hydroxyacid dehydrogenase